MIKKYICGPPDKLNKANSVISEKLRSRETGEFVSSLNTPRNLANTGNFGPLSGEERAILGQERRNRELIQEGSIASFSVSTKSGRLRWL